LTAASTGVQGLETIIPVAPVSSWYEYYRSNGLVRSPGGFLGEDMDVLYDFVHSGDPENRAHNDSIIRDQYLVPGQDRITGDFNAFWATRDYLTQMDSMKCSLFMCHGFNDWNVMSEHSLRFYEKAKAMGLTSKIYYNQLAHGDPPPFEMMNKWFTHYLHGIDNGVEEIANAWIVSEGEYYPNPYKDFPNPAAKEVTFYLKEGSSSNGVLTTVSNESSNKTLSFSDNAEIAPIELIFAENSENRLMFVTESLKNDIHISGRGKITIQISSSKPAANLSVYLVELPKVYNPKTLKMKDIIVTRAWADPQNSKSLEKGEALVPNQFYDLSFNFMPDDQVIDKGKQLGLIIFSSDKEFTLQPEKGTVLKVNLDKKTLVLPIVED
jgi:X-Pro dipeptidyl-peptidase